MNTPHRLPGAASIEDYARYLDHLVRPDTYLVGQLLNGQGGQFVGQRLQVEDPHTLYDGVAQDFLRRLSRAVYGETGFRRRKNELIPNMVTLEGDGWTKRYHLNVALQRPPWLAFPDFERICREVWFKSPWAFKAETALWIEPRNGDCVAYSLKDGIESLLPGSLTRAR